MKNLKRSTEALKDPPTSPVVHVIPEDMTGALEASEIGLMTTLMRLDAKTMESLVLAGTKGLMEPMMEPRKIDEEIMIDAQITPPGEDPDGRTRGTTFVTTRLEMSRRGLLSRVELEMTSTRTMGPPTLGTRL